MQSASMVGVSLYPHDAHVEWQVQFEPIATVSLSFSKHAAGPFPSPS